MSSKSKLSRTRTKRSIPNYFGHLVKSWIDVGSGVTNGDDRDMGDDIEMEVPVQLLQLPSHEGERTNRKDLSKFLGLDDSDGEEIVFIQTKPPQNFRRLNNNNNNNNGPNANFNFQGPMLYKTFFAVASSVNVLMHDLHQMSLKQSKQW